MNRKSLGVLVTSEAHGAHLYPLFRAAERKNIQLAVHLLGEGVRLCLGRGYRDLLVRTHLTICRRSAEMLGITAHIRAFYPHALTSEQNNAITIVQCARCIVL